jgi:DNA polymerase-3 subunit epsilon
MDFTAIDVETANPDLSSICQIGIVQFSQGGIANSWKSLINPQDYFDAVNIGIHGIDEAAVRSAPLFEDIKPKLDELVGTTVLCCHTAFDRAAIRAVHEKHGLALPELTWLDTARVVRRAWPERSRSGYGLGPVAEMLGISFEHHDAEEDARASGEILLRAIAHTGLSVSDWLIRVEQPITPGYHGSHVSHAREGNPEGPLYGETVVFTGALSITRSEAAAIAAEAGCDVADNVTAKTTLLVVGDQDIRVLHGHTKSSKHRKAEGLIEKGQMIRILREYDFRKLVAQTS